MNISRVAFAFSLSQRGTIPETKISLLSDLQDTTTSIILFSISTALLLGRSLTNVRSMVNVTKVSQFLITR